MTGPLRCLKSRVQTLRVTRLPEAQAVQRVRGRKAVADRKRVMDAHGWLCVHCKSEGRITVADVVDHATPLWKGGSDSDGNKQSLCKRHHDIKTAAEAAERSTGGV